MGYKGKKEQLEKLKKFKCKYYYMVNILDKDNHISITSFLMISVVILQNLNNKFFVKEALRNNLYIGEYNVNLSETYIGLINVKNFKPEHCSRYDLRNKTFTYEEYKKFIKSKFKDS